MKTHKYFREKLKSWAEEIKVAAQGNTCNMCQHYSPGACLNEFSLVDGLNLFIMNDNAPACPSFVSIAAASCLH